VEICADNTSALAYIRKQGGVVNKTMLKIAQDFWEIALQKDIQVTTRHVPGKKNITADYLSRMGQNHIVETSTNSSREPDLQSKFKP